jgi:hypothetical protein
MALGGMTSKAFELELQLNLSIFGHSNQKECIDSAELF